MRTTLNPYGIPRVLVRLSKYDREAKMSHRFDMPDGSTGQIITKLPMYEEVDKWELNVSVGIVIGMSDKVDDIQLGDIVIVDYIVDCDEQYLVDYDQGDKIVSVPCRTRMHDKDITVTSYGRWQQDKKDGPKYWVAGGEKNLKVAKKGDVDQLSLVLGVIRDGVLTPHESYLFCEPEPEIGSVMVEENGVFAYRPTDKRALRRKIVFAHPDSGFTAGQEIMAVKDSNFLLQLPGRTFDMIPVNDVMAIMA